MKDASHRHAQGIGHAHRPAPRGVVGGPAAGRGPGARGAGVRDRPGPGDPGRRSGTGGAEIGGFSGSPVANSLVRIGKTPGVLQLTLGKGAYSWKFIDAATGKALDKGSGTCH